MTLKQTLEVFEALDSACASGQTVVRLLGPYPDASVSVEEVRSGKGKTDFVKVVIAGTHGRLRGGNADVHRLLEQAILAAAPDVLRIDFIPADAPGLLSLPLASGS